MSKRSVFFLSLLIIFGAASSLHAAESKPLKKAPEFPQKGIWLNADREQVKGYRGRVTLVDFWDYASSHSIRNLAYIKRFQELYGPLGLEVIGIHAPDFEFEYKKGNLKKALWRLGVTYPVLMDNHFQVWKAFGVILWPSQVLIAADGNIVYQNSGEGHHRELEEKIREELTKIKPKSRLSTLVSPKDEPNYFDEVLCGIMSDEVRIGAGEKDALRMREPLIANEEGVALGKTISYQDAGKRFPRGFFAQGLWKNRKDSFEHARASENLEDYVGTVFEGSEVYGVLSSSRLEPVRFYLLLDSKPLSLIQRGQDVLVDEEGKTYVLVDEPRLYYLVRRIDDGEPHELKLYAKNKGASVHALSFGNRCLAAFEKF